MPNVNPSLTDRVKQVSRTTGFDQFCLEETPNGFSSFGKYFASGDTVFYAASDGSDYEVGSGTFVRDATPKDYIYRTAIFNSSNSDNKVNFYSGLKEVYLTYPGEKAVFTAYDTPGNNEIAVFDTNQILKTDAGFVIDTSTSRMGINNTTPVSALDVSGVITNSGLTIIHNGIYFNAVDGSGTGYQKEPFMRNELSNNTGTDAVFDFTGLVSQRLEFVKQPRTYVLCGPSGEDVLTQDYPTFRQLRLDDIPGLSGFVVDVSGWSNHTFQTVGSGLTFDNNQLHTAGTGNFNQLQTNKEISQTYPQVVSDSGMSNTIVNKDGFLTVPTFNLVDDVKNRIPAQNTGAIAFATGDNFIMIANGTSWVSGQLT
jgi:hypothetical protein